MVWQRALPTEVEFWARWIETRGADWPEDFRRRFDPQDALQEPLILDLLDSFDADDVSILDVGAGPTTWLGKTHPRKRLRIAAADPLADEYARLLERAGLVAPVPTVAVAGEQLHTAFQPGSFDIAYARNALDHSADPFLVIRRMLTVVRPGGFVVLRHWENEAQTMRYEELHQWNFSAQGDRLILWNSRRRIDVTAELADESHMQVAVGDGGEHARFVTAVIQRRV